MHRQFSVNLHPAFLAALDATTGEIGVTKSKLARESIILQILEKAKASNDASVKIFVLQKLTEGLENTSDKELSPTFKKTILEQIRHLQNSQNL